MANTMALQDKSIDTNPITFTHKVTLSGSYVQAVRGTNTGEVLTPNSATNPRFLPKPSASVYQRAYVVNGPAGFGAEILPGADGTHWLLKLFGTTPGTELLAGAYNAGLTGDLDFLVAFEARSCD